MKKFVFGTIFIIILFSCRYEDKINILDTGKTDTDTLHGEIQFPVIARLAGDIIVIDSLLLIYTPFNPDIIFSIFSLDGRVLSTFNKRGRGPDEYIFPSINKAGTSKLSLWDINNTFSEILIDLNSTNEIEFRLLNRFKIDDPGFLVYRLNPELFVSTIHDKGMFALFNNKGELVGDYFGNHPLRDSTKYHDRFQGPTAVSEMQNLFVFGSSYLGYICAYEINDVNQPLLKWEFYLHQKPVYTLVDGDVKWDESRHVQGVKDIRIINDKILVLYSGRSISLPLDQPEGSFSDKIYLLSMKGEVLKKYKLDTPVLKFNYSEKNSAIYGITMTDDWQIVKFDSPDLNL